MPPDINDPRFKKLAGAILERYTLNEAEANITSAVAGLSNRHRTCKER